MDKIKASFTDISSWIERDYLQTGGTRSKCIVVDSQYDEFFFKTSLKKDMKDYKYEFWSEIIASKIGLYLGFNVLDYNIALRNYEVGCLSKMMINLENEEMIEGRQYLMGIDSNYDPINDKNKYTFKFIEKALSDYHLHKNIYSFIDTLIFDSLIGNGDRHQENWAFIIGKSSMGDDKRKMQIRKIHNKLLDNYIIKFIIGVLVTWFSIKHMNSIKKSYKNFLLINDNLKGRYTPIYDSGSSLGRELVDEKVNNTNILFVENYVKRGKAELRWENRKVNHFELISEISKYKNKYKKHIKRRIKIIKKNYNYHEIQKIVREIDYELPQEYNNYSLPINRKEFIIKVIDTRYKELIQL